MSLPWRPKSSLFALDDLESKIRDISLERGQTPARSAATSSSSTSSPASGSQLAAEKGGNSYTDLTGNAKGKGKGRISGIFRRASVSIKGLVQCRPSLVTDTDTDTDADTDILEKPHDSHDLRRRQLRSSHAPSYSHHQIYSPYNPTSPTSGTGALRTGPHHPQHRPTTSHGAINATWHRLRQAASFRHSRVLYPDVPAHPHDTSYQPRDDPPYNVPRPGMGSEPPVIPRNGGSGARAAAQAWQQDMFPTVHPQGLGARPVLKNKRLTLDSIHNDRESGIGIAVTSSDSLAGDIPDLDMVTTGGEQILSGCASEISRIDFIDKLPVELAIQVLAHLDAADLARASLVSTTWREIASSQHIWRESYLREKTGTYATSGPIEPGTGFGVPAVQPDVRWKDAYRVTEELKKRWNEGNATSVYLNGHSDSIYCLQFDE